MDLLAALALVMVIEGLALAVLAKSVPQLLAELETIPPGVLRTIGIVLVIAGAALYLVLRSAGGAG